MATNKANEKSDNSRESQMLSRVRKWRKEAFEAGQRCDSTAKESEKESLLQSFGVKSRLANRRKPAA